MIKCIYIIICCLLLFNNCLAGRRLQHKRFVIHVPIKMRTHHHTHTVYSQTQSAAQKQAMYKTVGNSMHDAVLYSHYPQVHQHYDLRDCRNEPQVYASKSHYKGKMGVSTEYIEEDLGDEFLEEYDDD